MTADPAVSAKIFGTKALKAVSPMGPKNSTLETRVLLFLVQLTWAE